MHRILSIVVLSFLFFGVANAQKSKKNTNQTSVQAQKAGDLKLSLIEAAEWRNIGPFRGGRSCAVEGVAGKPNLFYFGATGGGVWKTTDGGRTWASISDGYFGGSIGSIAVAPSDPNVIYVGGGEKTVRGNVSSGNGVWKTEDGGLTWTSMGLKDTKHIGKIRIDPRDHNIVFVAAMGDLYKDSDERGVYKSIDGGKNWRKVLFANASAGAVDLVIDPSNHRNMYATTWNVRRTPYSLSSGGVGSAMWKTTDSGETWINISANKGLPTGDWGIAGVAVAHNDGQIVYALIENKDGGVFRSTDGGKTWSKQNDTRDLRQRAWYYTRIYTDTKDDNSLYVMNVNYHKSTDGGRTFKSYNAPHGDHHDLWIAPENPDRMIIADDGGAQVTYDGGETWSTYHNQPTAQFYRLTTDDHFPFRIYAAQQDNSTIRIAHRTYGYSIGEDDWQETAGGESAHIAVDPKDNEIVYGGSYGGFLTRVNHRLHSTRGINVWPDNPMGAGAEAMKYRFQWNFPIFFSKHNKDHLYTASNHLHLSTDEGQSWKLMSPDLTRNEKEKLGSSGGPITKDNTGVEYYATIFAAAESPVKSGLIWTGSDDGRVHVTRDGGTTWTEVTSAIMPKYLMINALEPSRYEAGTCYLAGSCYKEGDYRPYLFVTRDYGATWIKITSGIAPDHFTRVVREDQVQKGILYAGTEHGMYISTDDGANWSSFQLNLPLVPITDLAIKDDHLIAATQGRSIWILDDLSAIRQGIGKDTMSDLLLRPRTAYRVGGGQRAASLTSGRNHPGGVMTHFYLRGYDDKKDTITLTYLTEIGDTLRHFGNFEKEDAKVEFKKGSNRYTWNMSVAAAKKFEGMILWWASLAGPIAQPGKYVVTLSVNGKKQSESFEILKNPVSEGSLADIKSQHEFISEIHSKLNQSHQAIIDIRSMKSQISTYTDKIINVEVKAFAKNIDSLATDVEKNLYQTKNKSGQDPLNFPIKLTNKLAHLTALIAMEVNDFSPTKSMVEVKKELISAIDKELAVWEDIKTNQIKTLNDMIKDKQLDTIILK